MHKAIFSHYEIYTKTSIDLKGVVALSIKNTGSSVATYDRIGVIDPGKEVEIVKNGNIVLANTSPLHIEFANGGDNELHVRLTKLQNNE